MKKANDWILLAAAISMGFEAVPLQARPSHDIFPWQSERYERYIAVDDACGWPQLSLLKSGEVVMFIWPHPNHGATVGAMECFGSSDAGRHWRLLSTPVPNKPGDGLANFATGMAADGSLVVLVNGMDKRFPPEWVTGPTDPWPKFDKSGRFLLPVPAVSHDGGRTWQRYPAIPASSSPESHGWGYVPFGQIAPLADGSLGAMLYGYYPKAAGEECFFVSGDGGATWQKRGQLSTGRKYNETTWIRLSNGDLFAAARSFGHLEALRSTDNGYTWKFEDTLTPTGQHPANLITLPDGRILLTYGVRNIGQWGADVRIGDRQARNWSGPVRIVDLDYSTDGPALATPTHDGGYPSTIVMPDKTLLTAYYSRGVREHYRYHVGVVKWVLPSPYGPPP